MPSDIEKQVMRDMEQDQLMRDMEQDQRHPLDGASDRLRGQITLIVKEVRMMRALCDDLIAERKRFSELIADMEAVQEWWNEQTETMQNMMLWMSAMGFRVESFENNE